MKNFYKSVTDERLIIDVVAPGFGAESVVVKTAQVNGGDTFKVVVEGKYKGHTNKNGDPIPRVAFEKYVEDFKIVITENSEFFDSIDNNFISFNVADYDLDKLVWSVNNGVIRISIPKTELARGQSVEAVENADADSTGITTSDAVAD